MRDCTHRRKGACKHAPYPSLQSRTHPQTPMNRRIGPVFWSRDQPMFHRVDPAIPDMGRHVVLIPDVMLPIPPLPKPALLSQVMAGPHHAFRKIHRKARFDQPPPCRIVPVAARQGPDAMEMIVQHHPRVDLERAFTQGHGHRAAQVVNVVRQQSTTALLQGDSEEDAGTSHFGADVVRLAAVCTDHREHLVNWAVGCVLARTENLRQRCVKSRTLPEPCQSPSNPGGPTNTANLPAFRQTHVSPG